MILQTLCILCTICISYSHGFQIPFSFSSTLGDNVVLFLLAAFGTASLIGACALCFRRKKTFEKLENEAGSPENVKKNEYPIFRALSTDVNESSSSSAAIVPCERNNLSRDNLLNSSDNLASDDNNSVRRIDGVDSSEIVLLEKPATSSQRERLQQQQNSRDTIIYETEKRHQSPSSKTPLLYAKNVQSYQEQQPISEQIQQKSVANVFLSHETTLNFYHAEGDDINVGINNETMTKVEIIDELAIKNLSVDNETKGHTSTTSASNTNPFFTSTVEDCTVKEIAKDDLSEIESSINDNSEKYQILEEETDGEDIKNTEIESNEENLPLTLHRQNSKGSNCSTNDKSIEEALRVLDIAIGFDDEEEEDEIALDTNKTHTINLNEIKEEATFLVDSIVNDCEKILEERAPISEIIDDCFEDFLSIKVDNMSTPCDRSKSQTVSCISNVDVAKVLFPGGVDLSDELNNDTFPVSPNNETFDITQPQQSLQQPTINDKTFDANSNTTELPAIKIEKEGDEMNSEDLTTVTPVNTPIELSYSSETWNKISYSTGAISKQSNMETQNKTFDSNESDNTITFNHDGWYLHPQSKSETFEIFEEEDGNMEDMTSTYDQLRRQLTEMLPHAQGMSTHNDFLDDDLNKESNSPNGNNYGIKYGELDEASNAGSFDILNLNSEPLAEININYNTNNFKRPLSPILEESECDETCRTFILNNDTKLLDSTSTGVMESASADAIIGQMPKTLMASNDTLFNFEDTLSDPADLLMSPRIHTAGSSTSSTLSRQESHDRISNERTPTNEDLPKIPSNDFISSSKSQEFDAIDILKNNIRQHPLSLDLNTQEPSEVNTKYEFAKIALEEGSWPIELPEAQQIINDLSSPDQNRGDSLSFEQDVTYTIDDQKTCVSFVLKNDEERISEISEPNFVTESFADDDDRANSSLLIDDAISLETDDNFNYEINDENGNQSVETKEKDMCVKETEATQYENDSMNPIYEKTSNYDIDSLEAETKILNDELEADSIPTSHRSKSVYSNDSINENETNSVQNSESSATDCVIVNHQNDSSDDSENSDRKKGSSHDIRQVSCNQSVMSTSFTKEWSDDDTSHSSEEFMYVKGQVEDILTSTNEDDKHNDDDDDDTENRQIDNKGEENIDEIEEVVATWSNLSVQKSPFCENEEVDEEESNCEESAEEEESWKPSCWDQSLQPMRSSLKSPEKESSPEQQEQSIKNRKRVAFKIQRYHSVYEYPSEVVQLSPAYSEPHLWSNYLDDGIDYLAYANDMPTTLDGFNISSSSRPFHSNNSASALLHNTWPTESSDFSWSQVFQDSNELDEAIKETTNKDVPFKIEWPIRKNNGVLEEDDSGVCESSDSHSFGDLNYSKNSLKLPLPIELLSSSTSSEVSDFMSTDIVTKDLNAVKNEILNEESQLQPKNNLKISNIDDDESDKVIMMNDSILPTPLSGSIDSLSSHSASSNSSSPSFTTFGKENKIIKESDCNGKTSIIFIEDNRLNNVEAIDTRKMLGSSDDDSGFENVQIKCESN
ncbi:hypothetical protein PVAND_011334 [Polypedilum vanderplanki]|uniref:Uncharacterized protein n=1 Tax=Polypedilum vanderplanki TaxID=319348 RepID=A0A9J6CIU0_POLVA|nr:hypothetical protein PVAND_011334 [Polypedilum vanderplanki]